MAETTDDGDDDNDEMKTRHVVVSLHCCDNLKIYTALPPANTCIPCINIIIVMQLQINNTTHYSINTETTSSCKTSSPS